MDHSFRTYITGLQFSATSRSAESWEFIVELLGDDAVLESRSWAEFEARVAAKRDGDANGMARAVWKNYGAWRRRAEQRLAG
jgi:hypothetical protein